MGGCQRVTIVEYAELDEGETPSSASTSQKAENANTQIQGTDGKPVSVKQLMPIFQKKANAATDNGDADASASAGVHHQHTVSLAFDCRCNALLGLDTLSKLSCIHGAT